MSINIIKKEPKPKKGIMEIIPYVPGIKSLPIKGKIHKLSSNENPLGASKHAIHAYRNSENELSIYPNGKCDKLRQEISKTYNIDSDNIIIGNGSDELLGLLTQAYLNKDDEAIVTEHAFSIYEIQIRACSAIPIIVKEKNCRVDLNTILAAINDRTRIIFIANPGNPTGTYISKNELNELHSLLPRNILLVLDGAYAEYVTVNDYESGINLISSFKNIVMTRTFSKIYGLAGLRIGWMYASTNIIDAVNRIRNPFNVNTPAQEAGVAAIRDGGFLEKSIKFNSFWREWLSKELKNLGLHITCSVTNFILIHFLQNKQKSAKRADEYLKSKGYILRRVHNYGFPNALRLTVGSEESNKGVVFEITEFLK